jgi:hypothetical protein
MSCLRSLQLEHEYQTMSFTLVCPWYLYCHLESLDCIGPPDFRGNRPHWSSCSASPVALRQFHFYKSSSADSLPVSSSGMAVTQSQVSTNPSYLAALKEIQVYDRTAFPHVCSQYHRDNPYLAARVVCLFFFRVSHPA